MAPIAEEAREANAKDGAAEPGLVFALVRHGGKEFTGIRTENGIGSKKMGEETRQDAIGLSFGSACPR
jgi:hypothetical protein